MTRIVRLDGFEDARLARVDWTALAASGACDDVFQTREWLTAWWRSFGRGQLILLAAENDDRILALAPLFADAGEVYPVGSGGSDYLDFIGDTTIPGVLDGFLERAADEAPGFVGFKFYLVPDDSPTGGRLQTAAARLGLVAHDEGSLPAPFLELDPADGPVPRAALKQSLVRHERWFRREGNLVVEHLREAAAIEPHLEAFFDQHLRRWSATPFPSLFRNPEQRAFYRAVTQAAAPAGWLRFTRLVWNDRPVAFHFGFSRRGSFMWYKPSFEIELARRSPGEVLLRGLLVEAASEGARRFDFGLGDEPFKRRFANRTRTVRTWGLYPDGRSRPVAGREAARP